MKHENDNFIKMFISIFILLIFVSPLISLPSTFAQDGFFGDLKERWKKKRQERKEARISRLENTGFGLGGKDYRWKVTWITESGDYGPGDYGRKMVWQKLTRFYKFRVPVGYRKDKPIPVMLILHGGGGYPGAVRYQTDFDKLADREGFIAVFPAGHHSNFTDRLLQWNDGRPTTKDPSFNMIDDVGFVAALLDDVAKYFNIDKNRVYATGISNGSMMTYRLACELSDRIAAIATVSGQRAVGEYGQKPLRSISVMHFHGKKDKFALYDGGAPKVSFFESGLKSVQETIQTWVAHNGCSAKQLKTERLGQAVITYYGACNDNNEVILVTLEDGGHTWPGGKMVVSEIKYKTGPVNQDISSMEMIWEFFKKHPNSHIVKSIP